jgi:hypothetical protein
MFDIEKQIFNKTGIIWLRTYKGYDIEYVLNCIKTDMTKMVLVDIQKDYYTSDHFYKFTLVKIFNKFIKTQKKIYTVGQLLKYLESVNFNKNIIEKISKITNKSLDKAEKLVLAWNIIFDLLNLIKINSIFLVNCDYFFEGRKNNKKEVNQIISKIIDNSIEKNVNVIFEFKNDSKDIQKYIKNSHVYLHTSFKNIIENNSSEESKIYEDLYYGELQMYMEKKAYDINRPEIDLIYNARMSEARGSNQLKYVIFLLALAGDKGMTVTGLSEILEISPGATGSVLNRLVESALVRK